MNDLAKQLEDASDMFFTHNPRLYDLLRAASACIADMQADQVSRHARATVNPGGIINFGYSISVETFKAMTHPEQFVHAVASESAEMAIEKLRSM